MRGGGGGGAGGGAGGGGGACRACLATDVRLHSLSRHALEEQYGRVSGLPVLQMAGMPDKLCVECAACVLKFNTFKHKCERAHLLLQDMYNQHHEITEQLIKTIDRKQAQLASSVTFGPTINKSFNMNECNTVETNKNFDLNERETEKENKLHDTRSVSDHETESALQEIDIKKEDLDDLDNSLDRLPVLDFEIKDEEDTELLMSLKRKSRDKRKKRKKMRTGKKKKSEKLETKKIAEAKVKLKKASSKRIAHNKKLDCGTFAIEVMISQEQQMAEVSKRQLSSAFKESPYKCLLCYKSYIDEKTYNNHMMKHDPVSGEYQCDVCKNRYKQRRHLVNHIYKVHMRKYLCRFCSFVSLTPEQANNHNNWHTGVTYKCNICSEVFTKKSTQLSHVRLKHPSEHICASCGESFVSERGLVLHTRFMHKEAPSDQHGEGAPYCADCKVQFTSHEAWNKHLLISPKHSHDNRIANGCRECGECFPTDELLREHHRTHLKKRRRNVKNALKLEFPLKCAQCDDIIPNAMKYWQHFRRSHPGEKYPAQKSVICEHCGKGFQTNAQLVYHRYTHSGKRAYHCAVCDKSFYTPTQLWTHSKSHDESRPHVCEICRKGFKIKPALTRHMRIHTGEKPFLCDVCGKAFTDASSRKLHVRTVHLKEPAPHANKTRDRRHAAKPGQEYQF